MDTTDLSNQRLLASQSINFAAAVAERDESGKPYDDEGLFARNIDGRLVRVRRSTAEDFDADVQLSIDGQAVTVKKAVPLRDSQGVIQRDAEGNAIPRPTTIYDAATEAFVHRAGDAHPIPTLCHREHMSPVGVCRVCMVEAVEQTRRGVRSKLVPACVQHVTDGMTIHTLNSQADPQAAQRVRRACGMLTEILIADHLPLARDPRETGSNPDRRSWLTSDGNELAALAQRLNIDGSRFTLPTAGASGAAASQQAADPQPNLSSRMVKVDLSQCILCGRCSRGCNDVKENHVIGRFGKGYLSHIGFDLDDPLGKSSCVSCGECVISCPTGALEFQPSYLAAARQESGQSIDVHELLAIPLFSALPPKFVQFNQSAFTLRPLRRGEVLCREGEYGSTAFVIVRGRLEVVLKSGRGRAGGKRGRGFWRWLAGGRPAEGASSSVARLSDMQGTTLSDDAPIEVTPDDVIIGEMTCLNGYPRSATVIAQEDSVVVEIRRNVLYMVQRNAISRQFLDEVYRKRSLRGQIISLPIFAGLSEEQRQQAASFLKDRVELMTVEPGQPIFRQGEVADALYINRRGFIKVTQKYGVSQRVMGYVSPGSYFGEIGLLAKMLNTDEVAHRRGGRKVPLGRRTSSCEALDHVELIRIGADDFHELLRQLPSLLPPLVVAAEQILERDYALRKQLDAIGTDDFIDQGLFLGQSLLVLDLEKCTRCDECTKACADTHGGVTRLVREGLRFDRFLVASSCRSCMDPYCLVGCPVDAIHRHGNSLEIKIEDYCIGCGLCAQNCPYGNINMHGFPRTEPDPRTGKRRKVYEDRDGRKIPVIQQQATTCDLCRSIDGRPRCVHACPHDAAHRMSGQKLLQIVDRGGQAHLR
jgi:Fe-S-cluster-containing hydrogenase component 2/CRP-like cAMP-binding protein